METPLAKTTQELGPEHFVFGVTNVEFGVTNVEVEDFSVAVSGDPSSDDAPLENHPIVFTAR